ncbi:programmed cell death protein 2 [Cokeromyces recurvatus]|uniref:programmed cell death protein 2 n=1 Tax=Cokeromyces recurvatus TaxID=90255 RepID=UPI00221F9B6D|nr:programmed cell death protein 2 [Cokeromyces recurvatus]KAI7905781.1 programmed cell death protein 2 [Cokeromyces recurvatus]
MNSKTLNDTDSDVSELDPKELSQTTTYDKYACQLGYIEDPETPLTADTFPSKTGGKPAWLNPEYILSAEHVTCGNCEQPMPLLLQMYTPEDHPDDAFHRTVYVFCCKKGSCVKQDWTKSFRVFRSQLPRDNPYYPQPVESDNEDDDIHHFTPKTFKAPTECVICGIGGSKFCGKCGKAAYCSREHQMQDWNMCRHKEFCNKPTLTKEEQATVDQLRAARIFIEKEIVSEPEGKDKDEEEEEEQAAFFKENNPEERSDSKALVLAGDEAEEETEVPVDDVFLSFQLKIQQNPDQVIRYDRVEYDMPPREPLWVQENYKPESIPNCERCKGPRTFEFQILSTLLNYIGVNHVAVDSLDWGSLFIYSCKENCTLGNGVYAEEVLWKQDFSQDGMQVGPKDAKLLRRKLNK